MSNILSGINPISDIIGSAGTAIEQTGSALDELFTSDEERLMAKIEMERLRLEIHRTLIDAQAAYQDEISKRHSADMQSDNVFSKIVRPASLVFLLASITTLAITDGNVGPFAIKAAWVDLLQVLATTAFAFYFGGKSFERVKTSA